MKMTDLFAKGYATKAKDDTARRFTQRCRRFGDRMDTQALKTNGVSNTEIVDELNDGLIKYEPNCGITRRFSGYSLTAKGIGEVHKKIKAEPGGQTRQKENENEKHIF